MRKFLLDELISRIVFPADSSDFCPKMTHLNFLICTVLSYLLSMRHLLFAADAAFDLFRKASGTFCILTV